MADPISEQITRSVIKRLKRVRVANGYNVDLAVERADMWRGNTPEHEKLVLMEGDDVEQDATAGRYIWNKQFAAVCYVMEPEDFTQAVDARLNIIRADVEKELMRDPFFDDLALNVFLRGMRRFDAASESYGGIIDFDVQYRVSETDPYSE